MLNEFAPTPADMARERSGTEMHEVFVRGLVRSLPLVVLLTLIGATIGFAFGLFQANSYTSTTKLMLRPGAREAVTAESMIGLEGQHLAAPPTMFDEMQMLEDPAIFENVAQEIGPREILAPADPEAEDGPLVTAPIRWMHRLQSHVLSWWSERSVDEPRDGAELLRLATKALRRNTSITNEPGSNVVVIAHTSTSPEKARTVAQAIADAFVQRHRAQFSIQSVVEASRNKLAHAKSVRDEAASAYLEHVNKNGLVELDPRVPALQKEIETLDSDLAAAKSGKLAIAKKRALLSGRLQDMPAEVEVPGSVLMEPNEEYETQLGLKRELLAQRAAIPSLENKTIPERQMIEQKINGEIAKVDQVLKTMPKAVAKNPALRENSARVGMSTRVEDLDIEEQELDVTIPSLDERLTDKRKELSDLRKTNLAAMLKQRDLQTVRDAEEARYKELLQRFSGLEELGNIDLHDDPNLRLLQPATFEPEKVAPNRLSLILKGLCGGLLAGLAFAVVRQRLERRLMQPETFERAHGLPVLGVVPDVASLHRLSKRAVFHGS